MQIVTFNDITHIRVEHNTILPIGEYSLHYDKDVDTYSITTIRIIQDEITSHLNLIPNYVREVTKAEVLQLLLTLDIRVQGRGYREYVQKYLPIDIRKDKGILSTLTDKGEVVGIEILFM